MSKTTAIKVTDVKFRKFVKGNICGYATIEFNKVLKVNGFKIMHGKDGFFVAMPAHRADDDEWYSDVFISDEDIYNQFQVDVINAVLDDYDEDDLIDERKSKKSKKTSAKSTKSTKSTKSKKSDDEDDEDEDDEDDGLPF